MLSLGKKDELELWLGRFQRGCSPSFYPLPERLRQVNAAVGQPAAIEEEPGSRRIPSPARTIHRLGYKKSPHRIKQKRPINPRLEEGIDLHLAKMLGPCCARFALSKDDDLVWGVIGKRNPPDDIQFIVIGMNRGIGVYGPVTSLFLQGITQRLHLARKIRASCRRAKDHGMGTIRPQIIPQDFG